MDSDSNFFENWLIDWLIDYLKILPLNKLLDYANIWCQRIL